MAKEILPVFPPPQIPTDETPQGLYELVEAILVRSQKEEATDAHE